ncbi:6-bladed beta-propeller [Candidatus Thorarchaeota archaeon]|nr:MAG: 6-bladed beta-propeller [Candidatus Thorarchaeota archaeon]
MDTRKTILVLVAILPMLFGSAILLPEAGFPSGQSGGHTVTLDDGSQIEVGPDEVLLKYEIASAPTEVSGRGDPLVASEYGTRTDSFSSQQMVYYPSDTTTTTNLSVPLGDNWEGYEVFGNITSITENRTWLVNNDFNSPGTWTYGSSQLEGAFSGNNRIQYFTSTGTYQSQWGARGNENGNFTDPWGIAVNTSGYVYVVDSYNNRVQVFDDVGNFQFDWGSAGSGDGEFSYPTGIALTSTGNVYVADSGNDRIQVFDSQGTYVSQWGSPGEGTSEFHSPMGIAVRNSNGYIYVADMGNDRVQYFDSTGNYQGQFGGTGTSTGQFRRPTGIAINQNNDQVIVADSSNCRVQRFGSTGAFQSLVGSQNSYYGGGGNGYFRTPVGVAVSSSGIIYVSDVGNDRVQYFSSTGTYQGQWGSDGTGNGDFRFNYGIALNGSNYVYTSERSGTTRKIARRMTDGGDGDAAATTMIDGYYHRNAAGLYGFWYNPGDKAFVQQDITIDRGDVTWAGISLDYYADCRGRYWSGYNPTGFFELFLSVGNPDEGGDYLWNAAFDGIANDNTWYSTGLIPTNPSYFTLPDVSIMVGLRVTDAEWYRTDDIKPEGRFDNVAVYIKAKATPESINLKMNGEDVSNVLEGSNPVLGLGTVTYQPVSPWTQGSVYANFSWTPTPNPPDPNEEITVEIDVDVTAFARRYDVYTVSDTEKFTNGDNYVAQNGSDIRWDTNHYVAVPGGYENSFFFNLSIPDNRDVDHVGEPSFRLDNLTSDWTLGDPGDGAVNVSVYDITTSSQNGFWYVKGSSPNIIDTLQVWDVDTSSWLDTENFRANQNTRFRVTLSPSYATDIVDFTIYMPNGTLWASLQATVDGSGYATTSFVNLDAYNSSVGSWEVQAFVTDENSEPTIHNVGFFRRAFTVTHSTDMSVQYPVGAGATWSKNVTHGDLILLQLRVQDSDNTQLLAGGSMTYSWVAGSDNMNDLGTGEYSVTLDTGDLPSNGQFNITLGWDKDYYDSLSRIFTLNVIYTTDLLSPDAPGVDVPIGYDAEMTVQFRDQEGNPITDAQITTDWVYDSYSVTPQIGNPGYYTVALETDGVSLGNYNVSVTAAKGYYESRTIILSVEVRELFTSAIPSTSQLSLPVGYTTSFTITYTDTDHSTPITGSADAISCNWSALHGYSFEDYNVTETTTPGVYQVNLYSLDDDVLDIYAVRFNVERYGAQNHTFDVDVELRTHLTSFYLTNPIEPTPYTADVVISVVYYDVDADTGIVGPDALIYIESPGLPSIDYEVSSGAESGEYIISLPASQWGSTGTKDLVIYANWTGPTVKFSNETVAESVRITSTPTDIFIGENPVMTPFGENLTFSVIYFDVGSDTGIVNSTGPYAFNVHLQIDVLTAGQILTQDLMVLTEVDPISSPGEYRIEFNTSYLTGIVACDLLIQFNWTKGQLPLYDNQTLIVTVYSAQRQTNVDWQPLPVTPYDELVNLTVFYRDALSGQTIRNASNLFLSIQEAIPYMVYYSGDETGAFLIELDTSSWTPGTHTFHLNFTWAGEPYYQNRTSVEIPITVRERFTELTHGAYGPIQFANNLTLLFTYTDVDDYTSSGMEGGTLTLDASLEGNYTVYDNLDGTYAVVLNTSVLETLGTFTINATIAYGGSRYCEDATDFFYLTVVIRRTQLTSDLPDLAPYLTQANITVTYSDDNTDAGITGATILAECTSSSEPLELGVNYFVDYLGNGEYRIRISTVALGGFGTYSISIHANYTGSPYYQNRNRNVEIEVSRRPATITVSKSPLNTPYLGNVTFEVTATDDLDGQGISLNKSHLILSHGAGEPLTSLQYALSGANGIYSISIQSTILVSELEDSHSISVRFSWGDFAPFYMNSSTSTSATITQRFTQSSVLSTPPADIFYNATAFLKYTDYLTGGGISGASVTVSCSNVSSIQYWVIPGPDGSYEVRINTSDFTNLGRYFFSANFTWAGSPFYQNKTGLGFSIVLNPVATELSLVVPPGVTYYLGDTIEANVTFMSINTGLGIESANVTTNWESEHGTTAQIIEGSKGIYYLSIETGSLDAGEYAFEIYASSYLHFNRTVVADVVLAALPVDIELLADPESPEWGQIVTISVNITNARNGTGVVGGNVNLTILSDTFGLDEIGNGRYGLNLSTLAYNSGEYTLSIAFALINYEARQREFQIRIAKVPARLIGTLDRQIVVNGQNATIEAQYLIQANDTVIPDGIVSFAWTGGSGSLDWNSTLSRYVGYFTIDGASIRSYQIQVQASSTNYKSVTIQLTLEVREINTEISPGVGGTVLSTPAGTVANVSVYLNNTDLGVGVAGASLIYSISGISANLTELGGGWYVASVNTSDLAIREYILRISSTKDGYAPTSLQFTLTVTRIQTSIEILSDASQEVYFGRLVTFSFSYYDETNLIGVEGASTSFTIGDYTEQLLEGANGSYSFTLNTSIIQAGIVPYDISVSFQKNRYEFGYSSVKLRVLPVTTEVIGTVVVDIPVSDDYSQLFILNDTLNDVLVTDATATAIWEFGTDPLTNLGNGSYRFGPDESGIPSLDVRETPYAIRIAFTRGNYSRAEIVVQMTIRRVETELLVTPPPGTAFSGQIIFVRVTYWDIDHETGIPLAVNSTAGTTLQVVSESSVDYGNGTYVFAFTGTNVQGYEYRIQLNKTDYESSTYSGVVFVTLSPEQQALYTNFGYLALAILGLVALGAAYIRVWSVPKMLRTIRAMVGKMARGKIPEAPPVRSRRRMIIDTMNEDLRPVRIVKGQEDIAASTVDISILDTEELLQELAVVVGLAPEDIDTLRGDLEKMRPSERAGFIGEVLRQERARRAKDIAEAGRLAEPEKEAVDLERKLTEEELQHLRERLLNMGIDGAEAELMIEQARNLSKAEIDALLEQLGGDEE